MKILHVIFSLNIGGAETMLVDIINEQSKTRNVELYIINNDINIDLVNTIDESVRVSFFKRKPKSRNPISIIKFNLKIIKLNPTVIHFHNHNAINLLKFRNFYNTCLTVHDTNYPILNFYKYNKIFSISNAVKYDILVRGFILSKVIYNGISFEQIENSKNCKKFGNFKIIQISRLSHEKKGQAVLIKALDIIVNQYGIKNIELDLIGEGESLMYLKELVSGHRLEMYVNFKGVKSRASIYHELKNYNLLVQPSYYEGFGLTVVEAMAAKIPVLVSNIEGPMEIIDNGKYGYFFQKGNEAGCAEIIIKILSQFNNNEILEMVDKAYRHAFQNFNIKRTAQSYIFHY